MKVLRKTISLFLIAGMMILASAGMFSAFAEEGAAAVPTPEPTPEPELTEDGQIDSERLESWVKEYLKADGWDAPQCSMSIGLWYSGTGETWFYNADEWMYGVNWSKLPVSMYYAEKIANGELTGDSTVTGLQLEYALQTVLENSSGPSFYSMVTELGGNTVSNCAELVPQYTSLPESYFTDAFYQDSYYTARIMMEVTRTLFLGGEERFPGIVEYMKASQPWDMFKRDDLIRSLNAAQTHAAYWGDGAGDYIHCTAIIYTPTPIVLTIMMKNISDLDIIGGVARHIAVLAMQKDERMQQIAEAEEAAAQALANAEQGDLPGGTAAADSEEMDAESSGLPTGTQQADQSANSEDPAEPEESDQVSGAEEIDSKTQRRWILGTALLILLILIGLVVSLRKRKRHARRR